MGGVGDLGGGAASAAAGGGGAVTGDNNAWAVGVGEGGGIGSLGGFGTIGGASGGDVSAGETWFFGLFLTSQVSHRGGVFFSDTTTREIGGGVWCGVCAAHPGVVATFTVYAAVWFTPEMSWRTL